MEVKEIRIEEIRVGERFRKDLGDLTELAESIREKGVIQPVSVHVVDSGYELIAGGRRLAAAALASLEVIPAVVRDVVDEMDLREVELFENVHRADLHWTERNGLVERIHNLQLAKNAETPWKWSLRKTGELLGLSSKGGVSQILQVAKASKVLPELLECASYSDALKKLKRVQEKLVISSLRDKTQNAMPKGEQARFDIADSQFHIGDAVAGMEELIGYYEDHGGSKIALVECDPPYAVDLHDKKPGEGSQENLASYEEISPKDYPEFLKRVAKQTYDMAGTPCWLVWWFGMQWYSDVKAALMLASWDVNPIPCIWTKGRGQTLSEEVNLASAYEAFFIARKGYPLLVKRGRINTFDFPALAGSAKFHATQKPVELYEEIISTFLLPGSIIMSPFLGSGAVLRAAYRQNCVGFGWDNSEIHKDNFLKGVLEDCK